MPINGENAGILQEEDLIQDESDEFVIKEIQKDRDNVSIVAQINIDELQADPFDTFCAIEKTLYDSVTLALAGTGWTCECTISKKRTIRVTNKYPWDIVKQATRTYDVELIIDSLNKKLIFVEIVGEDKGAYFIDDLNLKNINIKSDTNDFYTGIRPIGKDGLTVESINDGNKDIFNHQYSSKDKVFIWKDERYTNVQSLYDDAVAKLNDMSKPLKSYSCDILNLANYSTDYTILDYGIGDIVTLVDNTTGTRDKQRIKEIKHYPDAPLTDTCEVANRVMTFDEIYQRQQETAATVENITDSDGSVDSNAITSVDASKVTNLDTFISSSATIKNLQATMITAQEADLKYANISDLNAANAKIGTLEVTTLKATEADLKYASITELHGVTASIQTIEASMLTVEVADLKYAAIGDLDAAQAEIGSLKAGMLTADTADLKYAKIDLTNIENGSIKTAMIDTGAIGSAQIADGSITDAKIIALTASKITAGDLDCANIKVTNLDCASLTVGQINGQQIAPGAVDLTNLADPVTGKINSAISDSAQALQDAITALTNANNAVSTATTAMTAANGKNTVIYSATTPAATGRVAGDTWFNTADGNKIYNFNGTAWVLDQLGTNAFADLSITNAKIGSVDAAKITTGYLDAARIEAKSISVEKIAVGDFTNYCKDPSFEMVTSSSGVFWTTKEQAHTGTKSLKMEGGSSYAAYTLYSGGIEVQAGDEFYVEFWAYRNNGNIAVKLNMSVRGYDGVWSWDSSGAAVAPATAVNKSWVKYTGVITIPRTGTSYPQFKLCSGGAQTGGWYFDDVIVRRRNRGELLVNGAVSAIKLAADSVDATKVVAGSINTICLAANAVTADKIAANSVTADKLTVGSGGNLYSTGYDTFEQMVVSDITYSKNSNVQISLSKDYHYYGSKSLCLYLPSGYSDGYVYLGNTKNNYGKVRVTVGKMYRISCYTLSSITGQGQLYVCDSGTPKASATVTVSNSAWTRLELTYIATTNFLSIRIDNDVPGAYMYFDAFQIEEVSNVNQKASAFSPAGTTVINGGNIVANSITATQIAAKTITGNQIAANSVTATELSVSSLSAISANLGTVTAGLIRSTNYVANSTGMQLNLASGVWNSKNLKITAAGSITCNDINAESGKIGRWTIDAVGKGLVYNAGNVSTATTDSFININLQDAEGNYKRSALSPVSVAFDQKTDSGTKGAFGELGPNSLILSYKDRNVSLGTTITSGLKYMEYRGVRSEYYGLTFDVTSSGQNDGFIFNGNINAKNVQAYNMICNHVEPIDGIVSHYNLGQGDGEQTVLLDQAILLALYYVGLERAQDMGWK